MKEIWVCPDVKVQRFVAQDYCGPCDTNSDGKIFKLVKVTGVSGQLRVDNIAEIGVFQTGEIWSFGNYPGTAKYSQYELDAMEIHDDKYLRGNLTPGQTERHNITKYNGTTGISYTKYSETLYAHGGKYAYKAEKISS